VAEEEFDRMLQAMPKIAEAVKKFPVELQQSAFDQLVGALAGGVAEQRQPPDGATETGAQEGVASVEPTDKAEGRRKRRRQDNRAKIPRATGARKQWSPERNIDFWPKDKQTFPAFVEEKKPTSFHQKNLVAVFWLEQVASYTDVNVGRVLAAYKAVDWKEPSRPDNSLQLTAHKENWIDTNDMSAIRTTPGGRNMIKDMPITRTTAKK
jgi:hypothetical protein